MVHQLKRLRMETSLRQMFIQEGERQERGDGLFQLAVFWHHFTPGPDNDRDDAHLQLQQALFKDLEMEIHQGHAALPQESLQPDQ
jgi:hypothetical protein